MAALRGAETIGRLLGSPCRPHRPRSKAAIKMAEADDRQGNCPITVIHDGSSRVSDESIVP